MGDGPVWWARPRTVVDQDVQIHVRLGVCKVQIRIGRRSEENCEYEELFWHDPFSKETRSIVKRAKWSFDVAINGAISYGRGWFQFIQDYVDPSVFFFSFLLGRKK